MGQWDVHVLNGFIFLFPVVATDIPLMAEQRHRKLILKLVDHGKLRSVQVLVRVHQRVPKKTDDEPGSGYERVPAMMAEGGEENNEQRHQSGIQGQQVVVGILPFLADVLRCLDVQLVLLQQMVLVLVAVFRRRPTLQVAGHNSATATDEFFQIVPSPVVHFVAGFRRRGFVAGFVGVAFQQEVRHVFFLSDFKFVADPCSSVGVFTTDHNHLLAFLDAFLHLLFPIASEGFLH